MSKYVTVLRTFDLVLADQLEELLRAEGVDFKRSGGSAALLGAGPSALEQRIEVTPEDLNRATDLLRILGSSHPPDSDSHVEGTDEPVDARTGPARFRKLGPGLTRTWLFACAGFVLALPAVWLFAEARRAALPSLGLLNADHLAVLSMLLGVVVAQLPTERRARGAVAGALIVVLIALFGARE